MDRAEDFSQRTVQHHIRDVVAGGRIAIHNHNPSAGRRVIGERCCRINLQAGAQNQDQFRTGHRFNALLPGVFRQQLAEKRNVGFDNPAAPASRDIAPHDHRDP